MPNTSKYVGLFDAHCGWEVKNVGGERQIVPTMNEEAIKLALEFTQDFRPDTVVLGGDQLNCKPISHWDKAFPGRIGNFTLKDELDYLDDVVLAGLRFKHKVRRIWHRGNHEKWITDLLDKNPGLMGLVSAETYLQLEKRGWEIYDYGEVSRVGKLHFLHGDTVAGGVNVARNAALRYGRNVRFGHYHTLQAYTLHNPIDEQDVKTAISAPCLAARGPVYGGNAPNAWVNGWLYGFVDDETGDYSDYPVVMANGRARVEGKVYGG